MEVKDTLDNIVARQKPGFFERLLGANRRIQDKITASLMRDNFNLLGEHQVQLRSGERDGLLKRIADRKIDADSFKNLLRKIDPGVDKDDTFKILSNYPQAMGVIAFYVEGNLLKRDLTIKDMAAFLDRYPDPISFEENKQEVLDRVAANNPVSKRKEYERTLRQMMPIVYGKRWEYWEQIRLLVLEAGQKQNHPEKSLKHRGVKQARKFQRIHRINETIEDGFLTAGRHVSIRKDGSVPSNTRTREVIEVDRQQDSVLQDEIKRLKEMTDEKPGLERAYIIAQETAKIVYCESINQAVKTRVYNKDKILLGQMRGRLLEEYGNCVPASLWFQVLGRECGLDCTLVRGNHRKYDKTNPHMWNEARIGDDVYLIDIDSIPDYYHECDLDEFMYSWTGFPRYNMRTKQWEHKLSEAKSYLTVNNYLYYFYRLRNKT